MHIETVEIKYDSGRMIKLPKGVVDSIDMEYIQKVKLLEAQHCLGLITDFEYLESLLLFHAEWCNV